MVTAIVGLPSTLPCHTLPDSTLMFTWVFEDQSLDISSPSSGLELLENGSLVIADVTVDDEGVFTCIATNSLGTAQGFVTMEVLGMLL